MERRDWAQVSRCQSELCPISSPCSYQVAPIPRVACLRWAGQGAPLLRDRGTRKLTPQGYPPCCLPGACPRCQAVALFLGCLASCPLVGCQLPFSEPSLDRPHADLGGYMGWPPSAVLLSLLRPAAPTGLGSCFLPWGPQGGVARPTCLGHHLGQVRQGGVRQPQPLTFGPLGVSAAGTSVAALHAERGRPSMAGGTENSVPKGMDGPLSWGFSPQALASVGQSVGGRLCPRLQQQWVVLGCLMR